jgi:hypothetical protein
MNAKDGIWDRSCGSLQNPARIRVIGAAQNVKVIKRTPRTSRADAEDLGDVMTEKLAELFAESATEEHALRPVRRRRLDS